MIVVIIEGPVEISSVFVPGVLAVQVGPTYGFIQSDSGEKHFAST